MTTILRRGVDRLLEQPGVYRAWQAPFAASKLRPFLRRTDVRQLRRVLDVGCGPGTNAPVFAGTDYVGVDINPEYIATASRRHAAGRFVVGDVADETVLPNERFDCVFANSLMHHLPDAVVSSLLRRMGRLATPDGMVHVLDLVLPDRVSPARALARLDRGRFARPLEQWRALFTEHLVERHLEVYPLGLPGVPLWWMVYFSGVSR
ncbi:MAG TPA: class I SAM-dependent methyltransferase [Gemmatimonadaceae bacterium]|nr:class I SAM-dependent methyltransferase [Gemmatimonadaceae bacterium]